MLFAGGELILQSCLLWADSAAVTLMQRLCKSAQLDVQSGATSGVHKPQMHTQTLQNTLFYTQTGDYKSKNLHTSSQTNIFGEVKPGTTKLILVLFLCELVNWCDDDDDVTNQCLFLFLIVVFCWKLWINYIKQPLSDVTQESVTISVFRPLDDITRAGKYENSANVRSRGVASMWGHPGHSPDHFIWVNG